MSEAPRLSHTDIQREVEKIFARPRRADLAALYGRGEGGRMIARGKTWEVVPTTCELDLRAKMPGPAEILKTGRVYLLDWTERPLPLDLACRFAAGRVFQIAQDARLAALFGARSADASLLGSGLAAVLLSGDVPNLKKVSGLRVEKVDAYRRFLDAWADLPPGLTLEPGPLAAWCSGSKQGPALAARADQSEAWSRLRDELRSFVEREAGPLGRLAWRAWEQGLGRRFLQLAVLVQAHGHAREAVAEGLLQGRLEDLGPGFGAGLLTAAEALVESDFVDTALVGAAGGDGGYLQPLLEEADGLVPQESFTPTRARSGWLPSGHRDRASRLAVALTALAAEPGSQHHARVVACLRELERHGLDRLRRPDEARRARLMAVRLASWLVARKSQPALPSAPAHQAAVELATRFAAEGGYVDWCRQQLRRPLPFGDELSRAIHAVLAAADAARRQDDAVFSEGVIRWVEAGRPAHDVLPLSTLTRRLGADLLADHPKRKLLVVLMDGMSWATAVQLLDRLGRERWAPILWRPKGHKSRASLPPVFAGLPTLTNVSRAAFFAGRSEPSFGSRKTGEDDKRWASNKALVEANGKSVPKLVMKAQLMAGEQLEPDVKSAVEGDERIVGVVVNAIDEQLKGSPQILVDYSTLPIKPLVGLLAAADAAERVVLLASDHGHVPGDAMKKHDRLLRTAAEGGARWREIGPDDQVQDFERLLPEKCWRPSGTKAIAAVWDETVANRHPHYGEHGGLSLAEVVAPALLIAPEWLAQVAMEDGADLETRPLPQPAWWDLDLGTTLRTAAPTATRQKKAETLPLFGPSPTEKEPERTPEDNLAAALRSSSVFKAHTVGRSAKDLADVLRWVGVLSAAGDRLPDQEFARRCGIRRHRVAGTVATMGLLNCDGFAMVEYERTAQQVVLHRSRLAQQYGLEL